MYKVIFYLGLERSADGAQLDPSVRAVGMGAVRRLLANTYGGYTIMNGAGGWTNDAGEVVEEGMVRVECYMSTERALPSRADVDRVAKELGALLHQHSVLVEWQRVDARMVEVNN